MATNKEVVQVIIEARDQLSAEIKKAQASVQRFNTGINEGGRVVGSMVTKLAALAGAYASFEGLKRFTLGIIEAAAEMEDAEVVLTTLTGSAEEARKKLEFMRKEAAKLPFEFREIKEAGVGLERFSLNVEGWLRPLADVAAFMKVDLNTAVENLGRAIHKSAGEAEMFGEKAIYTQVAKTLNMSVKELMALTGRDLAEALYKGFTDAEGVIAGQTEKLAKTLHGQISMVKDAWYSLQVEIAEAGLFDSVKGEIADLNKKIKELRESGELKQWAEETSEKLEALLKAGEELVRVITALFKTIGDNKALAELAVAALGGAVAFGKIKMAAEAFRVTLAAVGAQALTTQTALLGLPGAVLIALAALTDWYNREDRRLKKEVKAKTEFSNLVRETDEFQKTNKGTFKKFRKIQAGEIDVNKLSAGELQELFGVAIQAQQLRERKTYLKRIYPATQTGEKIMYKDVPDLSHPISGGTVWKTVRVAVPQTMSGSEYVDKKIGKIAPGLDFKKAFDLVTERVEALGKMPDFSKLTGAGAGGGAGAGKEKKSEERKEIESLLKADERADAEKRIKHLEALKAFAKNAEEMQALDDEIRDVRLKPLKADIKSMEKMASMMGPTGMMDYIEDLLGKARAGGEPEDVISLLQGKLMDWQMMGIEALNAELKKETPEIQIEKLRGLIKHGTAMGMPVEGVEAELKKREEEQAKNQEGELEKRTKRQRAIARLETEAYGDEWDLRRLAVREWAEDTAKEYADNAETLAAIEKQKGDRLAEIDKERLEKMKAEAGYYRDFNFAQLQRMLEDETTIQEEKYRIKTEIDKRIEEDEIGRREAFLIGWQEEIGQFQTSAQIMVSYGRDAAEQLRAAFSNTFFGAMMGEINSMKDTWRSFLDYMKQAFFKAVADMTANKIMGDVFGNILEIFGGKSGGGLAGAVGDFPEQVTDVLKAARGGIFRGGIMRMRAFADGGIATGPMLGVVGEGRYNEAVVPLPNGRSIPVDMRGGKGGVVVNMNVSAMDADTFREQAGEIVQEIATEVTLRLAPGAVEQNIEGGGSLRNYFSR